MSYQSTDGDLQKSFQTAKIHLKPGGIFLFDCWYGPAVENDPPVRRVQRYKTGEAVVMRIAEPVRAPLANTVDVHYHIAVTNGTGETMNELKEVHRMRYLFQAEVDGFSAQAGFMPVASHAWMTHLPPASDNWSACFVVRT